MGTFFKYMIYIALVIAVFYIAKGLWEENSNNTVEEVVIGVSDNAPANATNTAPAKQ